MGREPLSKEQQKALVAAWTETGRVLEMQRYAELKAQTAEESRQAAFDMLQLGGMLPDKPEPHSSGLVEMQRMFARYRRGGQR